MGFLNDLKKALTGSQGARSSGGGRSSFGGDDPHTYWIYAQCGRCGEPLRGRVDLMNDPSHADDEQTWIVRKGLLGSGADRCFQTVEVTLKLDGRKQSVIESEVAGGKLITAEEYEELKRGTSDQ